MTKNPYWEIRNGGLREGGPLYDSWGSAVDALAYRARGLLFQARREKSPFAIQLETDVQGLQEEIYSAGRKIPRPNITFSSCGFHLSVKRLR